MCSEGTPSPNKFIANLKKPMPLGKKLRLVARNEWIKISRGRTCCGHFGEPGC
jgi:hypothetical protein